MKKKILIMEKDPDILFVVSHIFESQGYSVESYMKEDGVIDRIAELQPDAVVLDIIKTTVEGMALCKAIKAAEKTRHIPVIVLSTHVKYEEIKNVCADEVLPKPFDVDELINVVQKQFVA